MAMKKKILTFSTIFCLTSMITGCTTWPGSPQTYAGINHGKVKVTDPKTGKVVEAEFTGGKEGDNINFFAKAPDGWEIKYSADSLKATEAQRTQAELASAISAAIAETAKILK